MILSLTDMQDLAAACAPTVAAETLIAVANLRRVSTKRQLRTLASHLP